MTCRRLLLLTSLLLCLHVSDALGVSCPTPRFTVERQSPYLYGDVDKIVPADLDGDGSGEAISMGSWSINRLYTSPNGTVEAPTLFQGDYAFGWFKDVAVADVNQDGDQDVIVADYGLGRLIVLPGTGGPGVGTPVVTTIVNLFPYRMAVGDFDRDTRPDIAFSTWERAEIVVMRGQGDGTFTELGRVSSSTTQTETLVANDLDGDGKLDLLLSHQGSPQLDLLFGRGDGTFETLLQVTGGRHAVRIVSLDVNHDGRNDIVAANGLDGSVTVNVNATGRAFDAPIVYATRDTINPYSRPSDLQVADFNRDGYADLLVPDGRPDTVFFLGNAAGTFDRATGMVSYYVSPNLVAAVPTRSAALVDVYVADTNWDSVELALNRCGDLLVTAVPAARLLSVGQTATINVEVKPYVAGDAPTGTVTILKAAVPLASGPVASGKATITLDGLAAGDHQLVAQYDGDANYDLVQSQTFLQRVTTETTTTTFTMSPENPEWGQSVQINAQTTWSTSGGITYGTHRLLIDGVVSLTSSGSNFWIYDLAPGSHTVAVEFAGSDTLPPNRSATRTIDIRQATSTTSLVCCSAAFAAGSQVQLVVQVMRTGYYWASDGTISLWEGNTEIASAPATGTYVYFDIGSRPVGTYYFRATYSGTTNVARSESGLGRIQIVPAGVFVAVASATADRVLVQTTPSPTGPWNLRLRRRTPATAWQTFSPANPLLDTTVAPNTLYIYEAEALDSSWWSVVATSTPDSAMAVPFTDDPLLPGSPIKAVHFTELITAINSFRAQAGLTAASLPPPPVGAPVTATLLANLRTAINEARTAIGVPSYVFTDVPLVTGVTVIKAAHVQQLRDAVR